MNRQTDRFDSIRQLDLKGAQRILAAVPKDARPTDLDLAALVRGVTLCATWYREARRYGTDAAIERYQARLSSIAKASRKLQKLIRDDDETRLYDNSSVARRLMRDDADIMVMLSKLDTLVSSELKRQEKKSGLPDPSISYRQSLRSRSAIEWLAGHWLPFLYFSAKFTPVGRLLDEDSSLAAFVHAVLTELNITHNGQRYSKATIVKAFAMTTKGRVRRKGARAEDDLQFYRLQLIRGTLFPQEQAAQNSD